MVAGLFRKWFVKYRTITNSFSRIKTALAYIYALAYPFVLFLLFETLNTASENFSAPRILATPLIAVFSGFALLIVFALIYLIIGNLFASGVIVAAAAGFFYVFSYYRLVLSGWVLVPTDLAMISHAGDLAGFTNIQLYPIMRVFVALVAALWVLLFFASRRVKISIRVRYAALPAVLVVGLFSFATSTSRKDILPAFGVHIDGDAPINTVYQTNGVLMGLYATLFYGEGAAEGAFSNEQLDDLFALIKTRANMAPYSLNRSRSGLSLSENTPGSAAPKGGAALNAAVAGEGTVKPNVIMILSEAFFDPTLMPNWTPSKDPVPNIHALSAVHGGEYTGGGLLTPAFAGSTCNPEWEILTGSMLVFAGGGNIVPYEQAETYFKGYDNRSLVNTFKENGYKTVSIHTYKRDFFNRDSIHPKLGFEKSVFAEDMTDAPIKGTFISDEYFTDKIIGELDQAGEDGDPLFLFGISMQNHYCFDGEKYRDFNEFEVESERLTDVMAGSLRTYCQGVYDADKQLGRLIEYCETTGRPTIIVFFGDHLPSLEPSAYEIYNTLGYLTGDVMADWSTEDREKIFTTPYIVWNNFGVKNERWGALSPYFLGALVARKAGLTLNYYYEYLLQTFHDPNGFRAYKSGVFIDGRGNVSDSPSPAQILSVNRLRAIQYDRIYGGRVIDDRMAELNEP